MKTTIMHLMSLFLILAFSASCGKKEGGGGSNVSNPLIDGSIGQTGTAAYNSVKAWYDGAVENTNSMGSVGAFLKESSNVQNSGGFSGSICLGFWNVGNCPSNSSQFNGCYLRNSGTGTWGVGTPVYSGSNIVGCNTAATVIYSKAGNADLLKAISGDGLTLIGASQSGTVYTLKYAPAGYFVATVIYTIDTSIHSLLNPVAIQTSSTIKSLKRIQVLAY